MKVMLNLFFCQILISVGCVSLESRAQHQVDTLQEKPTIVDSIKQNRNGNKWRPATYEGLIMGTSTHKDMLGVLGSPLDTVPSEIESEKVDFENTPFKDEVWYYYQADGGIPGKLVVNVDIHTKRIIRIIIHPQEVYLPKEKVIKHYGNDYVITRYSFDDCLGDWDSVPIHESPDGPIKLLEYRERGISVTLGDKDIVNHITYESEPPGHSESKCEMVSFSSTRHYL